MKRAIVLAGLAAAVAMPAPAAAQYYEYVFEPHIFYGVGVGADFIANNSDLDACDPNQMNCQTITELTGGGFNLFVGLRFSEYVSLEAIYDAFLHAGSDEDPYNLATLQSLRVDAKGYFWPGGFFEPYAVLGGGLFFIGDEYGVAKVGGGFDVGLGFDLYLLEWISLGVTAQYRGMYFDEFAVDWAVVTGAAVQEGFIHDIAVTANLALHTFY